MKEINHPYPEPATIFPERSKLKPVNQFKAGLATDRGVPLEIEYFQDVGWSLEVRYDLLESSIRRQPFSGVQESLERVSVTVDSQRGAVCAGAESLVLDEETGTLSLEYQGVSYWSSDGCPFSSHPRKVLLQEDIQSKEHTSWDEPTPWRLKPAFFESHMIRFRYPSPEGPILGLPGQAGEFNRRGYRYQLFNTDQPLHIPSRPEMYQSWPIIIHRGKGNQGWVGIFHDNPSRTFVDLGDFYEDTVLFESITNNSRVYIVYAPTLPGITEKFVKLLGKPVFPPAWAFGYQQSRYSYMNSEAVRGIARRLREEKIPCDALYFDIDYMDGYRVFTFNPRTFGDLKQCVEDLSNEGFRSVCIVDPGVKVDAGYSVYQRLITEDAVIKDEQGAPFEILCWPGKAVLPDFFSERARSVWADIQKKWLDDVPFDGLWNDMNEPSNFDGGREKVMTSYSAEGPFSDQFNSYGAMMAGASAEGWRRKHPDRRGLLISRSGYPGVQRHSVVWHGDNSAWWEHLRLAADTCVSYSLCGAFYTGPDIPGFFGNAPSDLAIRAFQLASFLPFYRGHSYKLNSSKEPFAFGKSATILIREAIKLRYSLIAEWYSQFERCIRLGIPPMQPIFSAEGNPVRDSFMLFDKLLVVPITNRDERARAIWLPDGIWYRLGETRTSIEGGRWILEELTLDNIPVFVRGGSIIVRKNPERNVEETIRSAPRFEVYRDIEGSANGYLFEDDLNSNRSSTVKRFELLISSEEHKVRCVEIGDAPL